MPEPLLYKQLAESLAALFKEHNEQPATEQLVNVIAEACPADMALALDELTEEQALRVFKTLDDDTATEVLAKLDQEHTEYILEALDPEHVATLLEPLPAREAANVLAEATDEQAEQVLQAEVPEPAAAVAQHRLEYEKGSAVRIMTTEFLVLHPRMTIEQAIATVKKQIPI